MNGASEQLVPGLRFTPAETLLTGERLTKVYATRRGLSGRASGTSLLAVSDVSFDVMRGETFGLVGESGCGKSTLARCLLRLTQLTAGRVFVGGVDVLALKPSELRDMRRRMQIVFQDPLASLDPRLSARAIVEEPLEIHRVDDKRGRAALAGELLEMVGISAAQGIRKPHEFSGGQRQRIALARALALRPELVVLDEPVSALDVSIQAQVLNLLRKLQDELHLTYVFIVHDLAVAEHFCDRVAVLYLGSVMELGHSTSLFREPLHPYTVALLSAVPIPEPDAALRRERIVLTGDVTSPSSERSGCPFQPRCPVGRQRDVCRLEAPPLRQLAGGHWVACHFPGELNGSWTSGTLRSIA